MTRSTSFAAFLVFTSLISIAPLQAQERELHWRSMDVVARLDADGRLHVRERQAMVFTGDWNGGERTFNIRRGQRFELNGIRRIDANGMAKPLVQGDLDAVDHWDWADGLTLRWRSRLPTDPVFNNDVIVYELEYTLWRILIPGENEFLLDHDFAFTDRAGTIEQFTLNFSADAVWQASTPLPLELERKDVEPYTGVVVKLPLRYTGAGYPAAVQRGVPTGKRTAVALVLVFILAALLRRFYSDERGRGRFIPLLPTTSIDRAWLDEHIFSLPPEVVGAAWDNATSSPEVTAMIARMVQEGKLTSRVEPKRWRDVLHLELKVKRTSLPTEERKLINGLFEADDDTTDTERIKKRYRSTGFDPAGLIRDGIERRVKNIAPSFKGKHDKARSAVVILAVVFGGLGFIATIVAASAPLMIATSIFTAVLGIFALVLAAVYRGSVVDTETKAHLLTTALIFASLPVLAIILGLFERNTAISMSDRLLPGQVGLALMIIYALMYVCIAYVVLRSARSTESPDKLELRRKLAAAREYFAIELRKPAPALEDAWYPYLLAFELGNNVDRWFRAFGGAASRSSLGVPAGMAMGSSSSSSSSSGWSGGGALFGGGGGFGGGGAGRTWAAAASSMSSGVSAPSSSSSSGGGGGGGGGSSGGGGGGGW